MTPEPARGSVVRHVLIGALIGAVVGIVVAVVLLAGLVSSKHPAWLGAVIGGFWVGLCLGGFAGAGLAIRGRSGDTYPGSGPEGS
jgi:hypothetical protein